MENTFPIRAALELLYGKYYLARGNLDKSFRHLDRAVKSAGQLNDRQLQALGYAGIGDVYSRQGKLDDAQSAYRRAVELGVSNSPLNDVLARVLDEKKGAGDDEEPLRRAVELSPDDVWSYYGLGANYSRNGNAAAAIAQFHQCLELEPRFMPARVQLAAIYYEQGNYPACIAEYRMAIQASRSSEDLLPDLYFGLGDAYRAYGDYEQALDSYRQGISVLETVCDTTRGGSRDKKKANAK